MTDEQLLKRKLNDLSNRVDDLETSISAKISEEVKRAADTLFEDLKDYIRSVELRLTTEIHNAKDAVLDAVNSVKEEIKSRNILEDKISVLEKRIAKLEGKEG